MLHTIPKLLPPAVERSGRLIDGVTKLLGLTPRAGKLVPGLNPLFATWAAPQPIGGAPPGWYGLKPDYLFGYTTADLIKLKPFIDLEHRIQGGDPNDPKRFIYQERVDRAVKNFEISQKQQHLIEFTHGTAKPTDVLIADRAFVSTAKYLDEESRALLLYSYNRVLERRGVGENVLPVPTGLDDRFPTEPGLARHLFSSRGLKSPPPSSPTLRELAPTPAVSAARGSALGGVFIAPVSPGRTPPVAPTESTVGGPRPKPTLVTDPTVQPAPPRRALVP